MKYILKMVLPHTVYFRKEDLTKEEVIKEINLIVKNDYGFSFIFDNECFFDMVEKKKCKNVFWNMKGIEIFSKLNINGGSKK